MANVLYLTYDGLLEPLGQSQVWEYLKRLSGSHKVVLVSFEKPEDLSDPIRMKNMRAMAMAAGVTWAPLKYHKRPSAPATAFDILAGILVGFWLTLRYRIDIFHARSYVPAVMALVLKSLLGRRFVFDMRGFWADERVDGGIWPRDGSLYRTAKWFEKRLLLSADRVVSLTMAAVEAMRRFPYLERRAPIFDVITTCTDLELFSPPISPAKPPVEQWPRPLKLGYVGTVGVWYLFDETIICFKMILEDLPDAHLHILNRGDHAYIRDCLKRHDIPASAVTLESTDRAGVARAMKAMDAGMFFIKPAFSKVASAPTKLGEFLGCGVPCLSNAGVGDMADILHGSSVGVALSDFSESAMREGIRKIVAMIRDPETAKRCRIEALRHFSIDDGVASYDRIYRELRGNPR